MLDTNHVAIFVDLIAHLCLRYLLLCETCLQVDKERLDPVVEDHGEGESEGGPEHHLVVRVDAEGDQREHVRGEKRDTSDWPDELHGSSKEGPGREELLVSVKHMHEECNVDKPVA